MPMQGRRDLSVRAIIIQVEAHNPGRPGHPGPVVADLEVVAAVAEEDNSTCI